MRPFVIDCDTGRDDALTLWICDSLRMPLAAVMSSYGNVALDQVVINNLCITQSFDNLYNIDVFRGVEKPIYDHPFYKNEVLKRQATVGNGLSDVELIHGTSSCLDYNLFKQWLISYTKAFGKIDYVIIGPASNFAKLLQDPEVNVTDLVARVVMMGGKFDALWDDLPGADFNVGADPYAVKVILQSEIPFYLVPMDVTWKISDSLANIQNFKPKTSNAFLAQEIMINHLTKYAPEPVFRYHDPILPFALQALESSFSRYKASVCLDIDNTNFGRISLSDNTGEDSVFVYEPENSEILKLGNDIRNALFQSFD